MHLKKGGAELMLSRLANSLCEDKDNLIFVVSLTKQLDDDVYLSKNIKVYYLNLNKYSPFSYLKTIYKLFKIYNETKPEVIHTWMYLADFFGGLSAKLSGYNNIIWSIRNTKISHSNFSINFLIVKLNSFLSNYIPRRIVSVSNSGTLYHQKIGFCKEKFLLIHNGYDLNLFKRDINNKNDFRKKYRIPINDFVILTIARYDKLKGHDTLLHVAKILNKNISNIKFVLIGRGVKNDNFDKQLSINGLTDNFLLFDFTDNVIDFYNLSDIYLSTSRSEGFPNVICEAMLMELVPVATNVGESKMIIGDAGYVSDMDDVEDLAKNILKLYQMESKSLQSLGLIAKNNITNNFGLDKIVNDYKKIYNEIIYE
jgi:glycosyltransferase involved in cell wall biosynthesis